MEEILQQILTEVKDIKSDIKDIKSDIKDLKQGQSTLEEGQSRLEEGQSKLEARQSKLEVKQSKLEEGQEKILNYLHEVEAKQATNHLELINEIKSIQKDISTVEIVTSSNYADIAKLKAVK